MNTSRRLSVADAASYAGVSTSFLNKDRCRGGCRFYKIGRRVVYDTVDLDEWLASSRRKSTSDAGQANAIA